MAQRKNKPKKEDNGIDVVNPNNLTEDELVALDEKTKAEKEILEGRLNKLNKKIKGLLWLWWFLPIIGFFIYLMIYQRRQQREENAEALLALKRAIAEKEIQLVLDQKRWDEINGKTEKN